MAASTREAVEVLPGRFYVAFLQHAEGFIAPSPSETITYNIDAELLYEPFYADFGPLNLGKTYRFCEHTRQLLAEATRLGKKLCLVTGPQPQAKANAAVLVGVFQVLYLNRGPDEAYAPLASQAPYMPFRDASCGMPSFNLQPIDCIRGVAKARDVGFIDASGGTWRFDLAEYEHYEQVENGDLNWIVPGKLAAFSGPAVRPTDYVGFRAMVPEDYWHYFSKRSVQAIVRLNKKVYDRQRFLDGGFQHHELYFPDGSCPSQDILLRFLALAEATPGALAVHCKAGLGRTGVLLCAYMMKHYRFTAEEVIGYIRVCRPGSVIGPQQGFVKDIQRIMWLEGDAYRAAHGPHPPALAWGVTPGAAALAAICGRCTAPVQAQAVARACSPASPGTPGVNRGLADLSLQQLQQRIMGSAASTPAAGLRSSSSFGRNSGSALAPQRLFSAGTGAAASAAGGPLAGGLLGARSSAGQAAGSRGVPAATAVAGLARSASASRDRDRSSSGGGALVPGAGAQGTGAGAAAGASLAALRATLHTDTVSAAARAKAVEVAMLSQSSEFGSSGWRTPLGAQATSPHPGGARPSSSVARVLAPNGQPRKLPLAMAAALTGAQQMPGFDAAAIVSAAAGKAGPATPSPATPQQSLLQRGSARLSAYYSS